MRMFTAAIVVLVLVRAGDAYEASKKEMKQLEGDWSMVSGEANGQADAR